MNDGDWICVDPNCGNINFARRSACYRCNKERPDANPSKNKLGTEIGKSAAEKSRGLFNADDWQCNKCANVNWARRQTCNVCNAPKFGEVEARTGYGGGYNERGVVEYRRREPSSDDEYDEFGRKKRKRRPDEGRESEEKVGFTEGAVFKNLPPAKPQMELNKEMVMPAPPSNNIKKEKEPTKKSGSLSDGSVCDVPPVSVPAVKRNQNRNGRQNFVIPHYKSGVPQRKRHVSSGEREQTGSSGYETGPKRARHENSESPVFHPYKNPVMENMVTSTNDVVYKFNGSTPAESFQVTYTIEERVKAAAFAIAYNNCKISTERFESVFDKPAPDFKTIFSWRQRLLTNGCLIDNHSSVMKPTVDKCLHCSCDVISNATQQNENKSNKNTVVTKLPNPDEIPIVSDSEDGEVCLKIDTQKRVSPDLRSVSVETLVLSGVERGNNAAVSSPGSLRSGARSHSASTQSSHSSSSASPSSKSAESDYEDNKSRTSSNKTQILPCRLTTPNTESDSVSYNSDDNNFLCRKFPEGRKVRRKIKKRVATIVSENPSNYVLNEIKKHNEVSKANIDKKINEVRQSNQPEFTGYSTTKLIDKPPLATGNIYTQNLRNMNVKPPNMLPDMEGCSSSEYVPTKFGATAKRNYQQFKDNVRRKGFWAKGNGTTLGPKRNTISSDTSSGYKQEKLNTDSARGLYSTTYNYSALQQTVQNDLDFTKDDIAGSAVEANVLPFDRPLLPKPLVQPPHPLVQPPHPLVQPPHPNDGVLRQRMPVKLPLPKNSVMNPPLPKDPPPLPKDPAPTLKDSPPLSHTNQSQPPIPKEHGFFKKSVIKKSTLPYINPVTLEVQPPLPKEPSLIVQQKCGPVNISLAKQDCIHLPLLEKQPLSHLPNDMQQQVIPLSPKNNLFIPSENRSMSLESNASIFEAVQSKSINKNRSLMDIFNEDEQTPKIPEGNDTLQNYNDTRKKYETEWNGDDDALYGDFEANEDSLSPLSMRSKQNSGNKPSANINVLDLLTEKKNLLMGLLEDFQIKPIGESEVEQGHSEPANSQTSEESLYASDSRHFANIDLSMIPEPDPMPEDISDEVIRMSHGSPVRPLNESTPNSITHKNIDPSKRVQVLESVTIHPSDSKKELSKKGFPKCKIISKTVLKPVSTIGKSIVTPKEDATLCDEEVETPAECSEPVKCFEQAQLTPQAPASQLDLSNLLSGINTNTLLLALQNLHQLSQNSLNSSVTSNQNEQDPKEQAAEDEVKPVETINLTNDEDWEKESYKEGSIERQLEQMDGDPSATPCLSDIFDPSPVKIPLNKATKLNINLEVPEELSVQQIPHLNENAPVIGNFKSFALPKPLILNRLKLAVKSNEKTKKSTNGKKRKKKSKPSGSKEKEGVEEKDEDDEEEESGDEGDLSKYDLWGSEDERENKTDAAEKSKEGESSKEDDGDKNGKSSPEGNHSKRSRRSSSSSSSSSSSNSSRSSRENLSAKNKFDDFNLNSERESSPKGRKSGSRSRSPRARPNAAPPRRKSRDSRSAGETRSHDKEWSRDRERRDRPRGDRKERRYSRDGNHFGGRHR